MWRGGAIVEWAWGTTVLLPVGNCQWASATSDKTNYFVTHEEENPKGLPRSSDLGSSDHFSFSLEIHFWDFRIVPRCLALLQAFVLLASVSLALAAEYGVDSPNKASSGPLRPWISRLPVPDRLFNRYCHSQWACGVWHWHWQCHLINTWWAACGTLQQTTTPRDVHHLEA